MVGTSQGAKANPWIDFVLKYIKKEGVDYNEFITNKEMVRNAVKLYKLKTKLSEDNTLPPVNLVVIKDDKKKKKKRAVNPWNTYVKKRATALKTKYPVLLMDDKLIKSVAEQYQRAKKE